MITAQDLVTKLLRCQRLDCNNCPMRFEEQVEQDLFRVCCAAEEAAALMGRKVLSHEQQK